MIEYKMNFINELMDELDCIKTPYNTEFFHKIFSVLVVCLSFTLLFESIYFVWLKVLNFIYMAGM